MLVKKRKKKPQKKGKEKKKNNHNLKTKYRAYFHIRQSSNNHMLI